MDSAARLPSSRVTGYGGCASLAMPSPLRHRTAKPAGRGSVNPGGIAGPSHAQTSRLQSSAASQDVTAFAAADVLSVDLDIPGQPSRPRVHAWSSPHDKALLGLVVPSLAAVLMDSAMSLADVGVYPDVLVARRQHLCIVVTSCHTDRVLDCTHAHTLTTPLPLAAMIGAQGTEALGAAGMTNLVINLSVSLLMGLMLLPTTSVAAAFAKHDQAKVSSRGGI